MRSSFPVINRNLWISPAFVPDLTIAEHAARPIGLVARKKSPGCVPAF